MEATQVSLAGVQKELEISLQRITDIVKFGLTAAQAIPEQELTLLGYKIGMSTAAEAALSFHDAKYLFQLWALRNGMRDAVEAVNAFLETARTACAAALLIGEAQVSGKQLSVAEWTSRVSTDGRKFHKLGLPDKIAQFATKYDASLVAESEAEIRSINQARNCLVHRQGMVTDIDVNDGDSLLVRWNKLQLIAEGPWGSCDISGDGQIIDSSGVPQIADRLMARIDGKQKRFQKGEAILFDAEEFSDIGFTCMLFGNQLVSKVSAYAIKQGLSLDVPVTFS